MKNIVTPIVIAFASYMTYAAPILQTQNDSTLRVGIVPFTEPFIMQASSTEYYGFDISTMNTICKTMNKKCNYIPVKRSQLLSAFDNDQIDLAIGDFVINAKMQQYVDFSMPYMTSQAQFIGLKAEANKTLDLDTIRDMRIGVIVNSAYAIALNAMNVKDHQIRTFETDSGIIAAIEAHEIDVGFINNYIANYWERNSGGVISSIGNPINIGFGLGLVLNPGQIDLLNSLNMAIYGYQNSPDFKNNYNMYLGGLEY